MNSVHVFPLERALQIRAQNRNESPDHRDDLYERYSRILSYLEREVYPNIDAGLAALSEDSGFYTLHDRNHFDEVVKYAGELLGCKDHDVENFDLLTAYELFVLLVAIRIHDAGNMYGRENHERRTFQILQQMGNAVGSDLNEKKFIADIARAHGGKAPNGSKDTIGQLQSKVSYGNVDIRPRLIAAILRFADEICESRTRAANILLDDEKLMGKNEVFHKYAACVSSVRVFPTESARLNNHVGKGSPIEVNLEFNLNTDDCYRKWGKTEDGGYVEVYIIEEISSRLDKMFRERQYCNKFMREICNVVHVKAAVNVWEAIRDEDGIPDHRLIWTKILFSEEEGYPSNEQSISERYGLTGESLIAEIRGEVGKYE